MAFRGKIVSCLGPLTFWYSYVPTLASFSSSGHSHSWGNADDQMAVWMDVLPCLKTNLRPFVHGMAYSSFSSLLSLATVFSLLEVDGCFIVSRVLNAIG